MLPAGQCRIIEHEEPDGRAPFRRWFGKLAPQAATKITTVIYRMSLGNFGDYKFVGEGVFEVRINFGPGYRIYLARSGRKSVHLLVGGTKGTQLNDIAKAKRLWLKKREDSSSKKK